MARVTIDEIDHAKEVRVIDFMDANGISAKQEGAGEEPYYRLEDHDSFVVKGEKFFWNSQQKGGYGAISFAMTYYDLKFPEAVQRVNEHEYVPTQFRQTNISKEPFKYPSYFEVKETDPIKDYLVNERKIDSRVVDWCIKKDLIVQDRKDNVVFKWKDKEGEVVGADRQGTKQLDNGGYFKGMIANSKDTGGFSIDVGKNPSKVAVFESPIDMLSYWSVHKNNVQDTKLLSMGGLKIGSVNQAIKDAHSEGNKIDTIISAVDNDKAGKTFHEKLKEQFGEDRIDDQRPKEKKDWNDVRKLEVSFKKNQKAQMGI